MWKTFYQRRLKSNTTKLTKAAASMPDMVPGLKKLIKFDTTRMNNYHDQAKQVLQKLKDCLHRDRRLNASLEDRVDN